MDIKSYELSQTKASITPSLIEFTKRLDLFKIVADNKLKEISMKKFELG